MRDGIAEMDAPSAAGGARSAASLLRGCLLVAAGISLGGLAGAPDARGDEQLWAFARGAETLPGGHAEFYQFTTLRTGKKSGDYYGLDFESELEYGLTDEIQASASIVNHYFNVKSVTDLSNTNRYRFGGVEGSVKARALSPFIDPVGLSLRVDGGYLAKDDVAGIRQQEWFLAPELALQKNFRDDTVFWVLDLGAQFAWGKQPAEEYPRELSLQGATGVAFRFAPNWFAGAEARVVSEYPLFDFDHFEHAVLYAGPSLHYGGERWWATLSWLYQAWGRGIEEGNQSQTFAEETEQIVRLKVGINF
jgi:hypothetical protein